MSIIKLQIPIDKSIRDALSQRAEDLGFDSLQAYIRFWAKAEVEGRQVNFGEDSWGQPSPKAAARLNKTTSEVRADLKQGKLKPYTTTGEFVKDLRQ